MKVNGTAVTSGTASGAINLAYGANTLTVLVTPAQNGTTTKTYKVILYRGVKGDFNQDGKSDFVYVNSTTRASEIMNLSNGVSQGIVNGPTLPTGWVLVDVADFDGDGKPDYLLFNASTRQSAIWYLNGGSCNDDRLPGRTVPGGYSLAAGGRHQRRWAPGFGAPEHHEREDGRSG